MLKARSFIFILLLNCSAYVFPQNSIRDEWNIDELKKQVVFLSYSCSEPINCDKPGKYVATGFILDKEHGLIATNAHVVLHGSRLNNFKARFLASEQLPDVSVRTLYYDYFNDFAILKIVDDMYDESIVK